MDINKTSAAGAEYIRLMAENGFLKTNAVAQGEAIAEYRKLESEGKPLPEGVYATSDSGVHEYYTIESPVPDMTADEIDRLIAMRQANDIASIKRWVKFFGILAIVGLIVGFVAVLSPLF